MVGGLQELDHMAIAASGTAVDSTFGAASMVLRTRADHARQSAVSELKLEN